MRALVSALLLVLALGTAGALAVWGAGRDAGETGAYPVLVVGPEGPMLERTVELEDATVLRALQAAADEAGLALELQVYPGMGTYVRAIGEHRASGAHGWVYEVRAAGGDAWTSGDRSAEHYALQKGDATRWTWTAG